MGNMDKGCQGPQTSPNSKMLHPNDIGSIENVELHFSDVNTTGCSQCSYIQIIAKRKVHCTLVIGKVRMAPTKVVTVLRLEFVAATVSAAVSNILKEEFNITRLTSQ